MKNFIKPNTDFLPITDKQRKVFKIVSLVLVVLLFSLYWYLTHKEPEVTKTVPQRPTPDMNREPESPTAYAQVDSLNTLSTSDDLGAIEADLESTNLESLTQDLNAIEAELKN
jgi:hypothetical protein